MITPRPSHRDRTRERGVTVIEIAFSAAILVVLLHSATTAFLANATAQQDILTRDVLQDEVRRTIERLTNHLRAASAKSVVGVPAAPATSPSMRFRRTIGFNLKTGHVLGAEERLDITDEMLTLHLPARQEVLGVHVGQVAFSLDDDRRLLISLTAESQGARGERIRATGETHVTLRN